jgi:hypothetical protein
MYKETITFEDYNGVERKETYWFNLTEAEIMEMEMSTSGGLAEMIQRVVEAQDAPAIIKVFKELVLKAYGVKSPDGRRFMKEDENGRPLYKDFAQTEAYSILFMKLATDAEKAAEFVNGIVPAKAAKAAQLNASNA